MANVTFKGSAVQTSGSLPAVGSQAPDFILTRTDLQDVSLKDYAGKRKLISVATSLDTGVCATSVRRFNEDASKIPGAVLLSVTCDLPFAQKRFCEAEGIDGVITLSEMRSREFGQSYGVRVLSGPTAGLLARSVIVVDQNDKVVYTEQVPELTHEPDYAKALAALKG